MAITDETIEQWERDYDVDIRYDADAGTFTVQSIDHRPPEERPAAGEDRAMLSGDSTYSVSGTILDDRIELDPRYAEAVGVETTGDLHADLSTIFRTEFEGAGGMEVLNDGHEGFTDTALHRVAIVAGALRTNGQIPPEVFSANASFGGSGVGPDFVAGGGQGGGISEVGIAHDIDHQLGVMGYGPMSALQDSLHATGEVPSGLHGLGDTVIGAARAQATVAQWRGDENAFDALDTYDREVEAVGALADVPNYFDPQMLDDIERTDDWTIRMNPVEAVTPETREFGPEGPAPADGDREEARLWGEAFETYVASTGDAEGGLRVLELTEDRNAETLARAMEESGASLADLLHRPAEPVHEVDAEHDYGIA